MTATLLYIFLQRRWKQPPPHDTTEGIPAIASWIVVGILVAIVLMVWKEIDKSKNKPTQ